MNQQPLAGRVAFVTGAARGIGRAIALALADAGAIVVAGVRERAPAATALAAELVAISPSSQIAVCDVCKAGEVQSTVQAVLAQHGRLDILINNAGVIGPIGILGQLDPQAWAENIQVNLIGALIAANAVLPPMLAQGSGVIVNISSGAAGRPLEGWSAYCAAKAGLAMLTRSLALEVGPGGVRVYGLRPGVVDTDMQGIIRASGINEVSRLRREDLGDPRIPAKLVAWLCQDAAADLAGQELDIRDKTLRSRAGLDG
ncbi:MAG: SDR family oxidoreductase [Roseiflexaceae bacterium]